MSKGRKAGGATGARREEAAAPKARLEMLPGEG